MKCGVLEYTHLETPTCLAQTSREIYAETCGCIHAATCVGIAFPTSLGKELAQKSTEIYADACGCAQPLASA